MVPTTSGIPKTKAEAQSHIEMIRNGKRDNNGRNAKDLEAVLELISNDMYQKPMHFLLELLQNADDNLYEASTTPTVRITYRNGTFRIDTNEIGFCKADVEAICSLGHSSKPGSQSEARRIGEKGIGFKSVFRVADLVFITSGHYSFMFSDREPLGKLTPVWARFPEERLDGITSILLQLRPTLDLNILAQELKSLDGRLLMFLQNLKEVLVEVFTNSQRSQITIKRQDAVSEYSGLPCRMLAPDIFSPYILFQFPVSNLPSDDKRKGRRSEIVLAFPSTSPPTTSGLVQLRKLPFLETHKVYAFLPIRDYGFKFVLQADFVLVANREEIESDSAWNKGLLKCIPHALLAAINEFNRGDFRFSWIRFLPLRHDREDFFQHLWPTVQHLLSTTPILESMSGDKMIPSALTITPDDFASESRDPLIPSDFSMFTYVSQKYPAEDREALESLGVRNLTAEDFLNDLSNFINQSPIKFQSMPDRWHSRLSQILDSLTAKYWKFISSLSIIPLRHGKWMAQNSGPLLFPFASGGLVVPNGISASVIHLDAANDPSRRTLLRKLQAQDATETEVCRIIIQTHAATKFDPQNVPIADMVSHATFLHRAKWVRHSPEEYLWVVAEDRKRYRSHRVYIESSDPHSASKIFKNNKEYFHFLHLAYSKHFSGQEHRKWLQENLSLEVLPRLARLHPSEENFTLNNDFRLLIRNYLGLNVLQLLRAHWNYYRQWIVPYNFRMTKVELPNSATEMPHGRIRTLLSSIRVQCRDGSFFPLDQTYLPRGTILQGLEISDENFTEIFRSIFPLLAVPDPEEDDWDFLEILGVMIKVKSKDLIARLQQLQGTDAAREQISRLYERIQASADEEDMSLIERHFREDKLIFIPVDSEENSVLSRWVNLADCIWDGPCCLKKTPRLRHYYPQYELLFAQNLKLGNATLKTLVAETKQIESADSLAYVRDILKQLSHMACESSYWQLDDAGLFELQLYPIFPVWTGAGGANFDCLKTGGQMTENNSWYIADLPYLRDAFQAEVPLLAFETSDLEDIKQLIKHTMCEGRKLSNLAKKEARIEGCEIPNESYTRSLREKWRYIARLIPLTNSDRIAIMKQLLNVHVCQPQRVSVSWKFCSTWGTVISGRAENGRVMLAIEAGILKIYLISEDMDIGCPPLELTDELSIFCGIENPEHIRLLNYILVQKDAKRVEQDLNRREVPDKIPENMNPGLDADDFGPNADTQNNNNRNIDEDYHFQPSLTETVISKSNSADDFLPASSNYSKNTADWGVLSQPNRIKQYRAGMNVKGYGLISLSMPISSISGAGQNDESRYIAELYVSGFLNGALGDGYLPHVHWTSHLRSRAGHKPYVTTDLSISTFTLRDTNGRLKSLLLQKGYQQVKYLTESPTFHIQVAASEGPVHSTFDIGSEQVNKAEKLALSENPNSEHKAMFILALVFNLYTDMGIALYPDPWQSYHKGSLTFETFSELQASFGEKATALYVHRTINTNRPSKVGNGDNTFKYKELKHGEIRLLKLEPGTGGLPLKGIIRQVPISGHEPFTAISYVWGIAPNPLFPSYFETPDGKLLLTHSLASALLQVRERGISGWFWADFICINQSDSREKGIQVRLMDKIFQTADRVIAWIGHEYEGSHQAIETLAKIKPLRNTPESDPSEDNLLRSPHTLFGEVPDPRDDIWTKINLLVKRPWFQRVWIVQELVLASNALIMCGGSELDWDHFFEALTICERESNTGEGPGAEVIKFLPDAGPVYALGLTRRRLRDVSKKYSLLQLLELFAHTRATMERDKLFALLGLAYDSGNGDFNPDYDSPLEEIILRYAKAFVLGGQAMDLLYRAGVSKSYRFCSWIPRLTKEEFPKTISTWDTDHGDFHAGLQTPPKAVNLTNMVLAVKGYSIDIITSIDIVRMETGSVLSFYDAMTDFRKLLDYVTDYRTGETREDLLFKLPIGNARRPHLESTIDKLHSYRVFSNQDKVSWPDNLRTSVFSVSYDKDPSKYHEIPPETQKLVSKYWQTAAAFSNRMSSAAFCFTRERFVGLVPDAAAVGDKICLLHGGKVPFVIRQRGQMYRLIGECYIHGIMYGEAITDTLQEMTFQLF
ncbi:hypothetical protein OIDMADRAFT_117507 [Oidiodendron maius Zn]|uniref:Heterokaryon incompatibility domain-containing protein n=1 Tax=Oidiodendron maius (strain Zn) TaxID=913774 RepID=A0A0C3DMZ1_OIDMZ|nr:hypothetical protein OIDMADRAFT_117507 [Oidiodendron maius Zn]